MREAVPLLSGDKAARPPPSWKHAVLAVCFVLVGMTSFILSNAFWAELPILVRTQPEGVHVAAYLILSLQLGNVVPALYMSSLFSQRQREETLSVMIIGLMISGMLVSLSLSFLASRMAYIAGSPHSYALFILAFLSACVSNTTNVVYYPFVGRFSKRFTSILSTGGGLSGLAAGLAGLVQNSGGEFGQLRFTLSWYFMLVAVVFGAGLLAFAFIVLCGDEFLVQPVGPQQRQQPQQLHSHHEEGGQPETRPLSSKGDGSGRHQREGQREGQGASSFRFADVQALLFQQTLLGCLAYGFIPTISPIVVSGYANASEALMWSNILGMFADVSARLLTAFWSYYGYHILTPGAVLCAAIMICCAALSPQPPFFDRPMGAVLPVAAYTVFQFLTGFTITELFLSLRLKVGDAGAEATYRWGGFCVQVGALLGTLSGFTLVVGMSVFKDG